MGNGEVTMATPDAQNPEVVDPPSLPVETGELDDRPDRAWSRHDWVTYALAAGLAFTAMGIIFVVWGDHRNDYAMVLAGAILFTVATSIWFCFLGLLTFQVLTIFLPIGWRWLKIALALLWRRLGI